MLIPVQWAASYRVKSVSEGVKGSFGIKFEVLFDVRSGSDSDVAAELPDVRSAPKNGHTATAAPCPFRADTVEKVEN